MTLAQLRERRHLVVGGFYFALGICGLLGAGLARVILDHFTRRAHA